MKKALYQIPLILLLCSFFNGAVGQTYSLVGNWEGKLSVSGMELRIVFHVESTEDGGMTATMDSPDQGAYDLPCGDVSLDSDKAVIQIPQISGKYEGTFTDERNISGTWTQGTANLPLDLVYKEEADELKRPQEPNPPFPYDIREVEFDNEEAGIKLGGTLTIPNGEGPFPAAIMVTGSGPQDRDETVMQHKPFWIIADYMARNGVAVLRYDDRGVGSSTGDFQIATTEDFVTDANAAITFLKNQEKINKSLAGIIGHSEGGMVAPMVAAKSGDVDFIVMLAGPGIVGSEIILLQSALIARASGASEAMIERNAKFNNDAFALILGNEDPESLDGEIEEFIDEFFESLSEMEKGDPEGTKAALRSQLNAYRTPWFKFFLTYDPVPTLSKVKCPVLALNGENDLQVPPRENLEAIETALKNGKSKNYRVQEMPGLNHLFQHSESGSPAEYAEIEETFSEEVMELMASWIKGLK